MTVVAVVVVGGRKGPPPPPPGSTGEPCHGEQSGAPDERELLYGLLSHESHQ